MDTITTAAAFASWLTAGPARVCIYHSGNLAEACESGWIARDLANAVWTAAVERKVYLLQRTLRSKNNARSIEYLAVRPSNGKVPKKFAPDGQIYTGAA
jgi:hypothetical protein